LISPTRDAPLLVVVPYPTLFRSLVLTQPGQQFARAAAQVEHPAAGGNPFLDDFQIGAHGDTSENDAVHVAAEHLLIARHRQQERSEEHTSELQSREKLVCRLLLE